jgi:hypothetical protein
MLLSPDQVRQQIANLKLIHPELQEDDEAWVTSLESETDLNEMLTRVVRRIEDTKALIVGTKDRADELKGRRDRFERRIEGLRGLLLKMMDAADLPNIELPEATISVRKGQPKLVGDGDPATLSDALCKISREPDRTKIKDALKAGETVPGFALSNAEPSISIRIK